MAWVLRYAHDSDGTPLEGNTVEFLQRHVEEGVAVRVIYTPDWTGVPGVDPHYPPYRKLIMDLDPVLSRPGAVFGQAEWRSLDVPPPYDAITFGAGDTDYLLNLSTTGKVWRRFGRAGGGGNPDQLSNWAMEWYCDL